MHGTHNLMFTVLPLFPYCFLGMPPFAKKNITVISYHLILKHKKCREFSFTLILLTTFFRFTEYKYIKTLKARKSLLHVKLNDTFIYQKCLMPYHLISTVLNANFDFDVTVA